MTTPPASPTIALVTGANKGIGLETARQLAQKGITVFAAARDEARGRAAIDKLKSQEPTLNVHFLQFDVTNAASIQAAVEQIGRRFGKLDILVNNAGVNVGEWGVPPSSAPLPAIRETFDTNFFGLIAVTQAFLPLIKKSPAGRIVNLSSILGSLSEHRDPKSPIYGMLGVGYNASKAALNMFTVNLAHELKGTTVKVNAAHPGWVKTDMGGQQAPLEVPDGAKTSVWLATLPADGPTGEHFHMQDRLRW
ncbi:MAG TPA: SDR family oxidoreductase [Phycisphaerales bacterium]|nr:SDR family oxidoreductase [Phycisphaerales bacterium]